MGFCGMEAIVDDNRVVDLRPDKEHDLSHGYVCSKGLMSIEATYGRQRLLHPLKRQPDGSFTQIPLERAIDEIADRLADIISDSGADAVGIFKGTQTWKNATANQMVNDFLPAIGSTRLFTTLTIDQSAKLVTMARMGFWGAGKHVLNDCDVMLIVGSNPLVSQTCTNLMVDPTKRLKKALQRGMKLIVIDPRRSETAKKADCFIQPYPGTDPLIISAILHVVFSRSWQDQDFCDRFVDQLDELEQTMSRFSPEVVAELCGVPAEQIYEAAELFARESATGIATAGTGPSMAPFSNLADHLIEALNVVCGRYYRAGDKVPNPGIMSPGAFYEEVIPANRTWESGPATSTGHGSLFGELMSGVLADEMLLEGDGRLRAMIVNGGNPVAALPDLRRATKAMRNLDLLVAVEPYMTATAELCHYILPPKVQLERTDTVPSLIYEKFQDIPFVQYAEAVTDPPPEAQVIDDWYVYWALARRLGHQIVFAGVPLDMSTAPSTEDLLRIMLRDARVPFEEIRACTKGKVFETATAFVQPARQQVQARLQVFPNDVSEELQQCLESIRSQAVCTAGFTHHLIVRRLRGVLNTLGLGWDGTRRFHSSNPAFMHPDDMARLGLSNGDKLKISSDLGSIVTESRTDATLRPGVIAVSHCWGGLPDSPDSPNAIGVSTNLLVRSDKYTEKINAMPRMTAIPVRLEAV